MPSLFLSLSLFGCTGANVTTVGRKGLQACHIRRVAEDLMAGNAPQTELCLAARKAHPPSVYQNRVQPPLAEVGWKFLRFFCSHKEFFFPQPRPQVLNQSSAHKPPSQSPPLSQRLDQKCPEGSQCCSMVWIAPILFPYSTDWQWPIV